MYARTIFYKINTTEPLNPEAAVLWVSHLLLSNVWNACKLPFDLIYLFIYCEHVRKKREIKRIHNQDTQKKKNNNNKTAR